MKKLIVSAFALALVASVCLNVDAADENKEKKKKTVDRSVVFDKLDKDDDGKLTKEEFGARAKTDEAKQRVEKAFTRLDKDKNGSLSKEEFVNVKRGQNKKKKTE